MCTDWHALAKRTARVLTRTAETLEGGAQAVSVSRVSTAGVRGMGLLATGVKVCNGKIMRSAWAI